MKKKTDVQDRNIIDLAERIVDEVEQIDDKYQNSGIIFNSKVVDSIKYEFSHADEQSYSYPIDGFVECVVSSDLMEAYMSFYPPGQGMSPINAIAAFGELERKNVVFGIDREKIEKCILQCNLEQIRLANILVARGIPATPEINKHVILAERFNKNGAVHDAEATQVDYKSILGYVVVTQGESIGTVVEAQSGNEGINVFGAKVPFPVENHMVSRIGSNLEERNGQLYSLLDGVLEIKGSTVAVKEVLLIRDNVDYHTGNIAFSGDVIIQGSVQDGFSIQSGGSVYAEKTLDASNVTCDGDLYVKQGIIGKKDGRIKVGNAVRAKFVENCLIEAGGSIEITTGIIRSFIYTCGGIQCGPKGIVVGGTFFAQNGFRAYQIGSETSPKTEIYCGLDYSVLKKLEWNKDQTMNLALALQKIRKQIDECESEVKRNELLITQQKIRDAIKKLNTISSNIVFNLDKNEEAAVEVIERIYPGVYVEICHVPYIVNRPMANIRLFLDKANGTIKTERLH